MYYQKPKLTPLPECKSIEIPTMESWLATGAITLTSTGNENLYFVDQFGNEFYCKCYPQ